MTSRAVSTLLDRLRDWWRTQVELSLLDSKEIGQVAGDLGLTTDALKDLVARGPDAAHLLYERMEALGISKADVDLAAHGILRDLQRTCAVGRQRATPLLPNEIREFYFANFLRYAITSFRSCSSLIPGNIILVFGMNAMGFSRYLKRFSSVHTSPLDPASLFAGE